MQGKTGGGEGDDAGLAAPPASCPCVGSPWPCEVKQRPASPRVKEVASARSAKEQVHGLIEGGRIHQVADAGEQAVERRAGLDRATLLAQQPQDAPPQHVGMRGQGGAP